MVIIRACIFSYYLITGPLVPPYSLLPQSAAHVIFLSKKSGYVSPFLKILTAIGISHISTCDTQNSRLPTCLSMHFYLLRYLQT